MKLHALIPISLLSTTLLFTACSGSNMESNKLQNNARRLYKSNNYDRSIDYSTGDYNGSGYIGDRYDGFDSTYDYTYDSNYDTIYDTKGNLMNDDISINRKNNYGRNYNNQTLVTPNYNNYTNDLLNDSLN